MIVLKNQTKKRRDILTSGKPFTQGQHTKVYNILTNGRGKGSLAAKTSAQVRNPIQPHSAQHATHMSFYDMLPRHLVYRTT